MATAREQAREAVRRTALGFISPEAHADAASDVWEPIVKVARTVLVLGWDLFEGDAADARDEAWAAIEEALGGD